MTNQDIGFVVGWTFVAAFAIYISYLLWLNDPRHVERVMAKKQERKKVADIVSAALQDACHDGKLTAKVWHKYNKKLAKAMGLPDMLPRKKFNLISALIASRQRLDAMGVNIGEGLKNLRRRRPTKKEKVLRALKKV